MASNPLSRQELESYTAQILALGLTPKIVRINCKSKLRISQAGVKMGVCKTSIFMKSTKGDTTRLKKGVGRDKEQRDRVPKRSTKV